MKIGLSIIIILNAVLAVAFSEKDITEQSDSDKTANGASRQTEKHASAKALEQAIKNLYSAFGHDPGASAVAIAIAETHFKLGVVYLSEKKPKKALEHLRKALDFYKKVSELSVDEAELIKAKNGAQTLKAYLQRYMTAISKTDSPPAEGHLEDIGPIPEPSYPSKTDRYIHELQSADDKYKRMNAARELAKLDATDATPALVLALHSDVHRDVRAAAARSLGDLGKRNATWALAKALRNKREHEDVRAEAAESLGKIGDPRALGDLRYALRNSSKRLKKRLERIIADLSAAHSSD